MNELRKLSYDEFPKSLLEINDSPTQLYIRGSLPPDDYIYLSVVGSRKYTTYGKDACERLIEGLRGYPVVIVSGLAIGIDSIAHKAALTAGLKTIAIPGSGLNTNVLYPAMNAQLAEKIIENGGCLLSEFEPDFKATTWSFPKRNRLMAGISHAVLVIEAEQKSGTLITSRLAIDYNRDVFAVPGSIFSSTSKGPHMLIRLGATPITSVEDLLEALNISKTESGDANQESLFETISDDEKEVLGFLHEPCSRNELIENIDKSISEINSLLSIMEIKGLIKEDMGQIRSNL
ncbi:DNA-protecting protein DprA [Candidatus Wolfebacteria bacterium]|nr:MAG: DNA-protecting protein DprA [Candidatus Wolfebacteria bacterium]